MVLYNEPHINEMRKEMKLQLDTKAMDALFPEGSEARVELQRAVIANFAKRVKDDHINHLVRQEIVRETNGLTNPSELAILMNKALRVEFDNLNSWGARTSLKDNSDIATALRDYVSRLQSQLMCDLRKEHETMLKATIDFRVGAMVGHAKEELAKVENELETRIRSNVSRQMDTIIKQELKKALS